MLELLSETRGLRDLNLKENYKMTVATATPAQSDNRPASAFISQGEFANAAFVTINRRLAPAKLSDTASNGTHISEWLNQNARDVRPQTVGEFADLLERAIKSIVYE